MTGHSGIAPHMMYRIVDFTTLFLGLIFAMMLIRTHMHLPPLPFGLDL
jgi:hypothetical protein